MYQQPTLSPFAINDFLEWEYTGQLVIVPKFQRRDVWTPEAKSYLIDTILEKMPIPPIYVRVKIDPSKKRR